MMEEETIRLTKQYASHQWHFGANTPASFSCEKSFPWGSVNLELQIEKGIISHAVVFTDAMEWELSHQLQDMLKGLEFSRTAMQEALSSSQIESGIREDLSRMLSEQEI